ncbi:beta-ketoacyl synthase N-terminal-like domain-containing protein [Sphingobacterium corticibacterium]|uniref:beta-ketoacyl synthase N-terminal-like domain-containing protein n=1 Tax=Sphingobacterium corticibacterium TaxID=2484746 RepID=UPI0013EE8CCA|nr:beta-ketoacyl synthase N-terminal-like domain-containing protein [Sphingobacterium corticibacterium]
MKRRVFINGIGAVTTQGVWRPDFFSAAREIDQAITTADQPSYKGLASPAAIRRMSRGMKMGMYAAQQALAEAAVTTPDAIITGTGLGCSEDSDKFLRSMWENDEQFLTPTSFIQSTHNTVAAQIALQLSCKGYNVTHVNGASSFESALLDTLLLLVSGEHKNVLLGGIDEVAKQTYAFLQAAGYIKADGVRETVKNSLSPGVNYAEGACFFSMGIDQTETSYGEVVDIALQNELDIAETGSFLQDFLTTNDIQPTTIDAVVLGYNGDEQDDLFYIAIQQILPFATPLYYKQLSGQFDSCSAFGLTVAASVLQQQTVPSMLYWNDKSLPKTVWKNILIYNHYRGKDHSLVFVRAC